MEDYSDVFSKIDAGRVLDVATGNGYFLDLLLKGVNSYTAAIGVDKKEGAAQPFTDTFKDNAKVSFAVMDGMKLDFIDASFDTVCISHSLHHLETSVAVLGEMFRVLRPGGVFIINEMYCDGDQKETQQTHVLLHHWMAKIDSSSGIYHRETYKHEELLGFARSLELHEIEAHDIADLRDDPMSLDVVADLNPVIDRYLSRLEGAEEQSLLGETIRKRVRDVGFHSASVLLIMARK